jgi:hypothetical protein
LSELRREERRYCKEKRGRYQWKCFREAVEEKRLVVFGVRLEEGNGYKMVEERRGNGQDNKKRIEKVIRRIVKASETYQNPWPYNCIAYRAIADDLPDQPTLSLIRRIVRQLHRYYPIPPRTDDS